MKNRQELPKLADLKPRLTVIGVGGAGSNAVNNMIASGLDGVTFVVANTDAQSLAGSSAERRLQLGASLTEGLGAGARPEIGQAAAEEAVEDIRAQVKGSHMVFIAAGMGGGTGTGAASVISRIAREEGALTVGVVTKPFQFEGSRRMRAAEAGIAALRPSVDTLIVIPNQNLFRIANEKTTFSEAFVMADQVLYAGIACIVDLIVKDGLINLDFADVRTIMAGMGTAMMGTGEASGERRAVIAAEEAISNPLLDDISLRGAKGLLVSITGGSDLTLYEVDEAATRVREEVDPEATIIVGATFDSTIGDRLRVSIVASGMDRIGGSIEAGGPAAGQLPNQGGRARPEPAQHLASTPLSAPYPAPGGLQAHGASDTQFLPHDSAQVQQQSASTAAAAAETAGPHRGATSPDGAAAGQPVGSAPWREPPFETSSGVPAPRSAATTGLTTAISALGHSTAAGPAGTVAPPQAPQLGFGPPRLHQLDAMSGAGRPLPPQPPGAPHAPVDAPPMRPQWVSESGAVFEDASPFDTMLPGQPQADSPHRQQPSLQPQFEPLAGPDPSFTPAPPVERKRAMRRLPDVDDFPAVGQRDYRAKMEQYGDADRPPPRALAPEPVAPPRKLGFFERLTGARKRQAQDPVATGDRSQAGKGGRRSVDQRPSQDDRDRRRQSPADDRQESSESAELPVFFGNNPRR